MAIDWTYCVGFAYLTNTKWCWTKSDIQGAPNQGVPYISGYRCDYEAAEESLVGRDPDGYYDLQETTTAAVRVYFHNYTIFHAALDQKFVKHEEFFHNLEKQPPHE